jgi:hypothetical protein
VVNRLAENAGWDQEILAIELWALIGLVVPVEFIGLEIGKVGLISQRSAGIDGSVLGREGSRRVVGLATGFLLSFLLCQLQP